jgi:ATP-binding cassette subfamily B protein
LGDLALFLNAVVQTEVLAHVFARWIALFSESLRYIRSLLEFLDGAQPAVEIAPRDRAERVPSALQIGFEFRHVSFQYPESDKPTLDDVSAVLPVGRVIAVVGGNGAGKSTLVKLLTRMYDPTTGVMLLDGRELSSYDLQDLRSRIAALYQDYARFAFTLGENIGLALIKRDAAGVGRPLEVMVRGRPVAAVQVKTPFYRRAAAG